MPPRKRTRDVIVCIPGITGSVLRKDGRDVWNVSGGAVISALRTLGESIRDLKLEDDSPDVDDLGDGITAPEVIRDVHLFPGFWKIDGYTKMLRYIEETFDVTRGQNLFEFPYDWRRDNRVAARRLARESRGWLEARRGQGFPDAKLVLVGHSMGGIIARYFLEVLDGWRDTRSLVTFGTPFRGSLNALDTLVNGKRVKFFDLSDLARSFTSIYQLLPTYSCYDSGDGDLVRVDEAAIPHLDRRKATAALKFHHEISEAVDAHQNDEEYKSDRYAHGRVVGIKQPTQQSAIRDANKIRMLRQIGGRDPGGDGTVPRPSATPAEYESDEGAAFSAERHASLQNDDHVLLQLTGVLTGNAINWAMFRRAVPMIDLALDLEDLLRTSDPLTVRALPEDEPGEELTAFAVDVSDGQRVAERTLVRASDEWYETELGPLREGVYRVSVVGERAVEPVSDLVTVLDE